MTTPAFLPVAPGSLVSASGRTYRVTRLLSIDDVLAEDVATRVPERLRVDALGPAPVDAATPAHQAGAGADTGETPDLEAIGEVEWAVARRRLDVDPPWWSVGGLWWLRLSFGHLRRCCGCLVGHR